jgi:hypothetical protein
VLGLVLDQHVQQQLARLAEQSTHHSRRKRLRV